APLSSFVFSFFTPPAPPEIYTLSLHDALPILSVCGSRQVTKRTPMVWSAERKGWTRSASCPKRSSSFCVASGASARVASAIGSRSEEHTSELQSRFDLVCRLLLEKKKNDIEIT